MKNKIINYWLLFIIIGLFLFIPFVASATYGNLEKGDINDDGQVNLTDAILSLQVLALMNPSGIRADYASSRVDINNDNKIGIEEVIYIMQVMSGLRISPPTGVTASAGDGQVSISWSAVSGATSYNIYWSTTSGVTKINGTQIPDATSPYTHTGRINGTTYYYIVTAVNSSGESVASDQVSATPTGGGGTWTVSEVGSFGSYSSFYTGGGSYLGIDSAGKPHIGYTYYPDSDDSFYTSVAYATRDNSAWCANVILTHANIGGLKLNTDGMPRTLLDWDNYWYSGYWYSVGYGLLQDDTWSKVAVEDDLHMGGSPSAFTLNAQDEALIVFVDPYNGLLRYAKVVGITPVVVTLISGLSTNEISELQIAADTNGYPHIAYITSSNSLVYRHWNGSAWLSENVVESDEAYNPLSSLSMALDGNDIPHFSYDDDDSGLVYTTKSGGSWISTTVDQIGAYSTSIAIDAEGYPHIAYAQNKASYAAWDGSAWTIELVEGNAAVRGISLSLDPISGKPRMSYFEHTWDILMFAERE